ncbi:MAG: methyltransferase domain-containing protein [Candidatus Bathyarchaeia archaeon]
MREWRKKLEIIRKYDHSAKVYDAQYAEEQNAKIKVALSHLNLEEDSLVLDVGCGTGLLFEHLSDAVNLLVGLDLSSGILKEAKKRAKRFPKTALIRADADLAPFPNEIFDNVFAITLLQNMPNPLLTLQEMVRMSKASAIIVVTGLKKAYSQNVFIRLLEKAGLEAQIVEIDENLKGYVALCKKRIGTG